MWLKAQERGATLILRRKVHFLPKLELERGGGLKLESRELEGRLERARGISFACADRPW